jgi:hypothetical protein
MIRWWTDEMHAAFRAADVIHPIHPYGAHIRAFLDRCISSDRVDR